MIYAPVIIPTLNRDKHLERCLTSLMKNSVASETEVYVSVDYPPAEKYVEGYERVKKVLEKDYSGFKKLHVIYQEENLGAGKNIDFLRAYVSKTYDRFIATEDDNEFSENFLEYMDKGLEKFQEDSTILGICGFRDAQWKDNGSNVVKSKLFAPYGYGAWFGKNYAYQEAGEKLLLSTENMKPSKMFSLLRKNPMLFSIYVSNLICTNKGIYWNEDGTIRWADSIRSIYMHFTDTCCIVPVKCKSRTWGNDGSGLNMEKIEGLNPEEEWILDSDPGFEYDIREPFEYDKENYKIGRKYLKVKGINHLVLSGLVKYVLLMFYRYDREKVIKVIERVH